MNSYSFSSKILIRIRNFNLKNNDIKLNGINKNKKNNNNEFNFISNSSINLSNP